MDYRDGSAIGLRKQLSYDPDTGLFYRNSLPINGRIRPAGHLARDGYIQIHVLGRRYQAHRLAWLFTYGRWPSSQLDHINWKKDDNRISNLREVTAKENRNNRPPLSVRPSRDQKTWQLDRFIP